MSPVRGALLGIALTAAGACARVAPHERGRVSQRTMQPRPALDGAFEAHVTDLREGVPGASGGESASCGCR